jgi:hypothetical protein
MKINKALFQDILKKSMAGVEDKDTSFSNTFSFKDGYVNTFRELIAVSVYIGDDFKTLSGSVKASEFYKLISKMEGEDIEIERRDSSFYVRCGRAEAEFALIVELTTTLFDSPDVQDLIIAPLDKEFMSALAYCKLGCDDSFLYNGVLVNGKEVMSTDGKRINIFNITEDMPQFMIEDKAAIELSKIDDAESYALSDTRFFIFLPNGSIVSSRLRQIGDYPYEKIHILLAKHDYAEGDFQSDLPESFKKMVERAQILSSGFDNAKSIVKVTLSQTGIEVVSKKDSGKYHETMDWPGEGIKIEEAIEIELDIILLFDALSRSHKFYISGDEIKRVIFTGPNCKCFLTSIKR